MLKVVSGHGLVIGPMMQCVDAFYALLFTFQKGLKRVEKL